VVGCGATAVKMLAVLVAPGRLADGATIDLEESEQRHLKVRRAMSEAEVLVFDGVGNVAPGVLSGRSVSVGVVQQVPRPAGTVLVVGAGDKERFLSLAERCTELGVSRLVPLVTERSQAVDGRVRDAALDKARRRAREACKQSKNAWATVVANSCRLPDLSGWYPGMTWLLAQAGGGRCPSVAPDHDVGWIIGPEGGLAPDELKFARERLLATAVGLGSAVLRFDTAAVAAAVITQDRRAATRG
jgi:16S rRNA (uracil1498-N3)-methyltransferase